MLLSRCCGGAAKNRLRLVVTLPRFFSNQRRGPSIALVVGSSGALGSAVARHLARDLGMYVIGADIVDNKKNDDTVHSFVPLPVTHSIQELSTALYTSVQSELQELDFPNSLVMDDEDDDDDDDDNQNQSSSTIASLDAIVCAAGGWQGDPAISRARGNNNDNAVQAAAEVLDNMLQVNLLPVLATTVCLQQGKLVCGNNKGGLVVVMGATAALQPTPGMMGYGVSKAAVHHAIQTLGSADENKPHKPTIVGILPTTLDTPANRRAMKPSADTLATWTKPAAIAEQIGTWYTTPSLRPTSGSLVKVQPDVATGGQGAVFQLVR